MKEQFEPMTDSSEWLAPRERAEQEAAARPERLASLRALVTELFPSAEQAPLRQDIERSFHVPQWGEHHNEGVFMDRHFEAILGALENLKAGLVPTEIPTEEREAMVRTAHDHGEALQRYVFLHDICKADLLRIERLPKEGAKRGDVWEGSLEEWQQEWKVPEGAKKTLLSSTKPCLLKG